VFANTNSLLFLPRDAMHSADYPVESCLSSVCPSVCQTPVFCRNFSHHLVATPF